jgi:hypothetical protein
MLIPGTLAMFGCVLFCVLNIVAYVRHMRSGDQAGFALGMLFLITWFIPLSAALLLGGAVFLRLEGSGQGERPLLSIVLCAGALFFGAFAALYLCVEYLPPLVRGGPFLWAVMLYYASYIATFLAFATNVLGCALVVRAGSLAPRAGGPSWFPRALILTCFIVLLQNAALYSGGIPAQAFALTSLPSLAWLGAVVLLLWRIRREESQAEVA